ncbi:MAG: Calx-beta domain-containing protein [Pirellulaceae bacterium]
MLRRLTVTLDYATANGTATLVDNDYQTATGTLSFAPGETTKTIDVLVSGDTTPEDYETLFVNLTNAVNAGITTGQGVVTIENDDTHISIDDVTVSELDSSSVNAVFTVMLSKASALTVSVQVDTQDMDAKAPGDYTAIVGGMVSFAPGETSKTVTVLIQGDTLDEFDEQYRVNLSTAVNGEIVDSFGLGTITDNDPPPSLSIDDVTVVEGDGGFVQAVFTVSLSAPSGKPISVAYATAGDTATAVTDFTSASGTLNFAAGVTSQQITVQIVGDLLDEFDETYFVNLTNPVNATISDGQGLGTITDNDPPPTVSIGNATVTEGDIGHVTMYFTVSLSTASGKPISVGYSTQSDSAIAGDDFVAASGTLNFASGETSQQVSVDILGDLLDEIDETFFVNLATPVNVTIDDGQGLGTITDNDPPPSLSISDASVVEGNSGTTNAVFTVTLLSASGKTVTVDYTTTNGTAVSPDDFATTSGTLTFAPGETSKQILVPVVGDTLDELTETFVVNLSNPNNATLADAQGVGTIVTDEAPKVASMVVGDGTSQRSNVTQIVVKFNSLVTIDDHLGDAISRLPSGRQLRSCRQRSHYLDDFDCKRENRIAHPF